MTGIVSWVLSRLYTKKTIKGEGAIQGKDGKSAYELAVESGFIGSLAQWLESLKGENGETPKIDVEKKGLVTTIKIEDVTKATINDGLNGDNGKSSYQIAVENGFVGSESDWLNSLKGESGRSITNISKTSSSGLEDTYTGTFSDGSTFTYKIVNGSNISKLSELQNDEGFIKQTVENLTNYYLKTELYNKDEIDDLMRNVGAGLALSIVDTLPTDNISPTTIYLIKTSEVTTHTDYIYQFDTWVLAENAGVDTSSFEVIEVNNLPASGMLSDKIYRIIVTNTTYAQYIRIGNAWANLGSTGTNLSNYYDKAQITVILESYVKKDELANTLADYAKKDELATVAKTNKYTDLDEKPEIPSVDGLETVAHAEQTYATKEELASTSQIDDETTSASKTWSSQKTNTEIDKAKIVEVADRAAYEQIRANAELYSAEKFYAFPEDDSLCIIHDDKELTGKSNTLQLGEPVAVTFPFTATTDGILNYSGSATRRNRRAVLRPNVFIAYFRRWRCGGIGLGLTSWSNIRLRK